MLDRIVVYQAVDFLSRNPLLNDGAYIVQQLRVEPTGIAHRVSFDLVKSQ